MTFQRNGISFTHPDDWSVEQQDEDDGWTATIQSPATAFILVTYWEGVTDPEEVAGSALAAMREEYKELDIESAIENLAGQPAVGYDVAFLALDLPVSARLRAINAGDGTLLFLCQAPDSEEATAGLAVRELFDSLRLADEAE